MTVPRTPEVRPSRALRFLAVVAAATALFVFACSLESSGVGTGAVDASKPDVTTIVDAGSDAVDAVAADVEVDVADSEPDAAADADAAPADADAGDVQSDAPTDASSDVKDARPG